MLHGIILWYRHNSLGNFGSQVSIIDRSRDRDNFVLKLICKLKNRKKFQTLQNNKIKNKANVPSVVLCLRFDCN